MSKTVLVTLAMAAGLTLSPAFAQNLQMTEPPAAEARAMLPSRGTSMAQVEARYGAPADRYAAVGQPPITRWVYPSFVVYFEYQHVVHTVAVLPVAAAQP
jgi:hypothetical protein